MVSVRKKVAPPRKYKILSNQIFSFTEKKINVPPTKNHIKSIIEKSGSIRMADP
jgi:hypothetical protein